MWRSGATRNVQDLPPQPPFDPPSSTMSAGDRRASSCLYCGRISILAISTILSDMAMLGDLRYASPSLAADNGSNGST